MTSYAALVYKYKNTKKYRNKAANWKYIGSWILSTELKLYKGSIKRSHIFKPQYIYCV